MLDSVALSEKILDILGYSFFNFDSIQSQDNSAKVLIAKKDDYSFLISFNTPQEKFLEILENSITNVGMLFSDTLRIFYIDNDFDTITKCHCFSIDLYKANEDGEKFVRCFCFRNFYNKRVKNLKLKKGSKKIFVI